MLLQRLALRESKNWNAALKILKHWKIYCLVVNWSWIFLRLFFTFFGYKFWYIHDRWCLEYESKGSPINCNELLAVYYSLGSFKTYFQNKHVKILSDSQVGGENINKMGTTISSISNDFVKNIWLFSVKNKIWITAVHIPGAENVTSDYKSRRSYKDAGRMLNWILKCFKRQ